MALVNAPFTWPKRVDSSSSGGSEPLFTATKTWSARGELAWMALATSSLPVPVSPVIRMVERLERHLADQIEHAHHALALADDVGEAVALLERALELGVLVFEAPARRSRGRSRCSSFSLSQGFEK